MTSHRDVQSGEQQGENWTFAAKLEKASEDRLPGGLQGEYEFLGSQQAEQSAQRHGGGDVSGEHTGLEWPGEGGDHRSWMDVVMG